MSKDKIRTQLKKKLETLTEESDSVKTLLERLDIEERRETAARSDEVAIDNGGGERIRVGDEVYSIQKPRHKGAVTDFSSLHYNPFYWTRINTTQGPKKEEVTNMRLKTP